MKKLNVVAVYSKDGKKVLMCKRLKDPYKGMFNLVGGKLELGEDELEAAYRELSEETGITKNDVKLIHVMNFQYKLMDKEIEFFAGKLNKDVETVEEINKLYWMDAGGDFYDNDKFAGEGNIGVMLKQVDMYRDNIF